MKFKSKSCTLAWMWNFSSLVQALSCLNCLGSTERTWDSCSAKTASQSSIKYWQFCLTLWPQTRLTQCSLLSLSIRSWQQALRNKCWSPCRSHHELLLQMPWNLWFHSSERGQVRWFKTWPKKIFHSISMIRKPTNLTSRHRQCAPRVSKDLLVCSKASLAPVKFQRMRQWESSHLKSKKSRESWLWRKVQSLPPNETCLHSP